MGFRSYSGIRTLLLACAASGLATGARGDDAGVVAARPVGRWQDASLDDYRKHLVALQGLTQACAKGRNVASCDPVLVGPDDRIPLGAGDGAGRRMVRYGWLRILFSRAEEPDKAQQAPGTSKPGDHGNGAERATALPTTSELLQDADERLKNDLAQTERPFAQAAQHDQERAVLKAVLEGREFRDLKQPTSRDTVLERVNNWLNRTFARIDKLRARSAWVGRALMWGFFLAVGIGLGLGLMRIERRWRVRLVPTNDRPAPGCGLGARLAIVDGGCAGCSRARSMARCDSLRLLGIDFAAGVERKVAGGPRANPAGIPGIDGQRRRES